MALPDLPIEGQDPWYDDRTAWDLAVEADLEGRLSETSLNNAYNKPIIYSQAYGLTGVGDEVVGIENFLAAAKSLGAIAMMEQGKTFSISRGIVYNGANWDLNGCTIKPTGPATSLIFSPGYTGGAKITGGYIINGVFDLNAVGHSAIWFVNVEGVRISRNSFSNPVLTSSSIIRLNQNTVSCEVSYNTINQPLDDPLGTYPSMSGISCTSDVVDAQSGGQNNTLTFQNPTNVSRKHRIFKNNVRGGTHGISLYGAEYCTVEENFLDNFGHRGVILSPRARFNKVINNTIVDFGSTGIHMAWGCENNLILGNFLSTTRSTAEGDGIKGYFGCSNNLVANNTINGVTGSASGGGVRFSVGSIRNTINDNRISGCTTGVRLDTLLPSPYYQPTTPPAISGTTIEGNTVIGVTGSDAIILNALGGINITRTVLGNNNLIFHLNGLNIIESSASVASISASNNSIDATNKLIAPRVAAHFTSAFGNEGFPDVTRSTFLQMSESAEPIQPATSDARLYIDSSGGKRRLMVKFATGVAQQVAIQP